MDADEKDICIYLKSWAGEFVSAREISRRAGGKYRYRQNPDWAAPVLARLVDKKIIESDSTGHYRLVHRDGKKDTGKKWVSPHVKKILEKSGKGYEKIIEMETPEDFFEE